MTSTINFALSGSRAPLSVAQYRMAARRRLPPMIWAYLEEGADDLVTRDRNRAAFSRWSLRQRVLRGSKVEDLHRVVGGSRLRLPVLLAPTGLSGMIHWHGELGAARAAEHAGTRVIVSTASTYSLEEVAEGTNRDHWFQLYPWGDHTMISSLIERARRARYQVMVVTVDVPTQGNRESERRSGMGAPPTITPQSAFAALCRPRWTYGLLRYRRTSLRNLVDSGGLTNSVRSVEIQSKFMRPDLSWSDLSWIRAQWSGPLYVKGILDPDDAVRAIELGAQGIIVSNHGGRQLDGAVATLDALGPVAEAVGSSAEILVDGGIRRGSDIVRALCLGARACLIGRPFLYGLAVGGTDGVTTILAILEEELRRTLQLMGCRSIDELDRSWLKANAS